MIGERFFRPPPAPQTTVGGQALPLDRDAQSGRWRQAAGVGSGNRLATRGGDGAFGSAVWTTLTWRLRAPHDPRSA